MGVKTLQEVKIENLTFFQFRVFRKFWLAGEGSI